MAAVKEQTSIQIRSAIQADYEGLLALDTVASQEPERALQIQDWIGQSQCYVAERKGVLLGYGVLNYHFFGHGFVEMLMVGESGRGQGIGSALLRYFRQVSQTEKLFSSTNQSNQAMHGMFQKLGFRRSGVIENLDEGDPEIVYVSLANTGPQA
ncbi:GNAT family N-acetyltransferase [Alcaligenes sp. 1735tsa3]|uniref:GNAT family N-acetyltransferase n=1 Tax=Alcaligenes sp. 1735tsa3 TaxID=2953809 RepID=UPI0020A7608A|nr:GNAT family N-acetyltransferase [Alcaligenes sp. 1735tsa3]USY27078.1 GNAT family N-acetyltransferase [Alcaligenes sp. 1735tsa3]